MTNSQLAVVRKMMEALEDTGLAEDNPMVAAALAAAKAEFPEKEGG